MGILKRNSSAVSPRTILTIVLIAAFLPGSGACTLLKNSNSNGAANSNTANANSAGGTGQAEVLEPVAGRLSLVSGDIAISHTLDPQATADTGGAAPVAGGSPVQPAAGPSVYSRPAAGPPQAGAPQGAAQGGAPPSGSSLGGPAQGGSAAGSAPQGGAGSAPQGGQSSLGQPVSNTSEQGNSDWTQASNNMPLTVGDRLYVPDGGKVLVGIGGRKYVRFDPGSTLEVVSMSKSHTQLAFRSGSAIFDISELQPNELCEVATPCGAIDFTKPGLYQIGFNQDGSAALTVLNGQAQVMTNGGSQTVTRGQMITLPVENGQAGAQAEISDVAPALCGQIINEYYTYRYGSHYDGRYADYNVYLSDPYYYDPYVRTASYKYIPDDYAIAGLDDLDGYGDWAPGGEYGNCWFPRVEAGWSPYHSGYWVSDGTLGLSWCASESWGWAPYHYGRWAYVNDRWGWVPTVAISTPVYSPALVAFVSFGGIDAVGWCPLGPGDPWVPRYYDYGFNPYYVGVGVDVTTFHNYFIAGAVTAVAVGAFASVITPGIGIRVDRGVLAGGHPFLDPYRDPAFRRGAIACAVSRPRVAVGVGVRESFGRPVVAGSRPLLPGAIAARGHIDAHVSAVAGGAGQRSLNVTKTGAVVSSRGSNGLPLGHAAAFGAGAGAGVVAGAAGAAAIHGRKAGEGPAGGSKALGGATAGGGGKTFGAGGTTGGGKTSGGGGKTFGAGGATAGGKTTGGGGKTFGAGGSTAGGKTTGGGGTMSGGGKEHKSTQLGGKTTGASGGGGKTFGGQSSGGGGAMGAGKEHKSTQLGGKTTGGGGAGAGTGRTTTGGGGKTNPFGGGHPMGGGAGAGKPTGGGGHSNPLGGGGGGKPGGKKH
ncbi:MAG TPA: DUF6600 domain-containing protein [Blastocatellia bacterium]|nr:DUF6600 domain-containing protein [Blastocatellia bacterium]